MAVPQERLRWWNPVEGDGSATVEVSVPSEFTPACLLDRPVIGSVGATADPSGFVLFVVVHHRCRMLPDHWQMRRS